MKVEINKNGEITITTKISLNDNKQKTLIKKVVTNDGYYIGEEGHDRWSALYNAYDMVHDSDIRGEHENYATSKTCNRGISRIDFLIKTKQINKLLYVGAKLYKKEFEEYAGDYINI